MRVRFAFLFLSAAFVAPHAASQCIMVPTEVAYTVCTQWWDGTTTCHWQLGWDDVESCDTGGGPGGGGPGQGGGPDPPPPPPSLEIRDISDANPGVPVLRITENDAVVETTVAYNGNIGMTTGKTDTLLLTPLDALDGEVTITVQARNAAYIFAIAICHIYRLYRGPFTGSVDVKAVWTKLNPTGEPEQVNSEWHRTVHLDTTQTSYDIPTFDDRNGEWEHRQVVDQIAGVSDKTPNPAWDTRYTIDNRQLLNYYYGQQCDMWAIAQAPFLYGTICTDVNAFTRAGSSNGTATILDLDIGPLSGTWLADGQTIAIRVP